MLLLDDFLRRVRYYEKFKDYDYPNDLENGYDTKYGETDDYIEPVSGNISDDKDELLIDLRFGYKNLHEAIHTEPYVIIRFSSIDSPGILSTMRISLTRSVFIYHEKSKIIQGGLSDHKLSQIIKYLDWNWTEIIQRYNERVYEYFVNRNYPKMLAKLPVIAGEKPDYHRLMNKYTLIRRR